MFSRRFAAILATGAISLVTAITALASGQSLLYIPGFGSYQGASNQSDTGYCGDIYSPFNWAQTLAYKFDYYSPAPQSLYWYYVDAYGASISNTYGLTFNYGAVYLYDNDGSDTRNVSSITNHAFLSYDLTHWINGNVNFNYVSSGNREDILDMPVAGWDSSGPHTNCAFESEVVWYD